MPPFVLAECKNLECKHRNRFDLAELIKNKGKVYRGKGDDQEFSVTCQKCGQKFKFIVPGEQNGKAKDK